MSLNGCSKKICPLQVGTADNCNLTKEQCPYFTQDIDYYQVLKQIKVEVAKEIFEDFTKHMVCTNEEDFRVLAELKKKYMGEKEDAEIH